MENYISEKIKNIGGHKMRLPALIIASAGNGYQTLYKSTAFDSLNPRDLDAVCRRMDGFKFDGRYSYFITQSLGKMVIGKSTLISKPEYGERKIKVTHCYFLNMGAFIDVVRGYRRQGAVISTFKEHIRQDYDESVEEVSFVRRPFAENTMNGNDIVDAIISLGMVDSSKKFMFSDINPEDAMKVLFGYFPSTFISDLSLLTNGESESNDMNVLFGRMNVISDNRLISVHTASKGISNITDEIASFVMSGYKDQIVEIMGHVDKLDMGYLAELVSVTRIVVGFEQSGVISASQIIKLMDKATTIEGKMSIYGLVIDMKNKLQDGTITSVETLERYWAFVFYTSLVNGDKKNSALVHNVCANQKKFDRERYLYFIKEAITMRCDEIDNENLALLVLLSHEKTMEKTKLINNRYDIRAAKAFLANHLELGQRKSVVENILMEMVLA